MWFGVLKILIYDLKVNFDGMYVIVKVWVIFCEVVEKSNLDLK